MAVLILFNLVYATFVMARVPNDAEKAPLFMVHMVAGLTILVLVIVRYAVRLTTRLPAPVPTGSKILDVLSAVIHWSLYLAAFGMGLSGLAIAVQSGLFGPVFAGAGEVPVDFYVYPPRIIHGMLATVVYVLIGIHVAAALFHEIVRKDRLMRRMWFGKR
jgi:cytochrome b561